MNGLPILDVKKPKKKPDTAPEPLPPHAFLMGITSPPRSGKSNLLMSIIGASHMYGRDYFDEIYTCREDYLNRSPKFKFFKDPSAKSYSFSIIVLSMLKRLLTSG